MPLNINEFQSEQCYGLSYDETLFRYCQKALEVKIPCSC